MLFALYVASPALAPLVTSKTTGRKFGDIDDRLDQLSAGDLEVSASLTLSYEGLNPRAQRLYQWFGFEQIHRRPRYYRDGATALVLAAPVTMEP